MLASSIFSPNKSRFYTSEIQIMAIAAMQSRIASQPRSLAKIQPSSNAKCSPFTGARPRLHLRTAVVRAAAPAEENSPRPTETTTVAAPVIDTEPEVVFYEGSGSNAELAVSLGLAITIFYLPLTMSTIGRRLWMNYRFTNKRLIVTTTSPIIKQEIQIEYSKIKEIRSVPRALGLWGDMVVYLKDGSRLEIVAMQDYDVIRDYVEGFIIDEQ